MKDQKTRELKRLVLASLLTCGLAVGCLPDEPVAPPDANCPSCDTCEEPDTLPPDTTPDTALDTLPDTLQDTLQDTLADTVDTIDPLDTVDSVDTVPPDTLPDTLPDIFPCSGEATCDTDGVCEDAVALCTVDGWVCDYEALPSWESKEVSCDGLDNDCDGETDEALPIPKDICKTKGMCKGLVVPVCQMQDGWACGYEQVPGYEAPEVTCDGLDNDCDGQTDAALCLECDPGEGRCQGSAPQVCVDSGNSWETQTCTGGTRCLGPGECTDETDQEPTEGTTGYKGDPNAVRLTDGKWVVAWTGSDGTTDGVSFRMFGADGVAQGPAATANLTKDEEQSSPALAATTDGSFMIVWRSFGQFGSGWSLVGRVFGQDGQSGFGEGAISHQKDYMVSSASVHFVGGRYAAVWEGGADEDRDVFIRWLDATTGMPLASAQAVAGTAGTQERFPSVARLNADTLLVVWQHKSGNYEIRARKVSFGSMEEAKKLQSESGQDYKQPVVASNGNMFAVLWFDEGTLKYFARVFDPLMQPVAAAVPISPSASKINSIALAPDGKDGFIIILNGSDTTPASTRVIPLSAAGVLGVSKKIKDTAVSTGVQVRGINGAAGKLLILWDDTISATKRLFGRFTSLDLL